MLLIDVRIGSDAELLCVEFFCSGPFGLVSSHNLINGCYLTALCRIGIGYLHCTLGWVWFG